MEAANSGAGSGSKEWAVPEVVVSDSHRQTRKQAGLLWGNTDLTHCGHLGTTIDGFGKCMTRLGRSLEGWSGSGPEVSVVL